MSDRASEGLLDLQHATETAEAGGSGFWLDFHPPTAGTTIPSVATTITMTKYTTIENPITPVTRERTVYVEQVEAIPDDAAVFHYDELDETLKHRFPALSKHTPTEASVRTENVLSNGDYVKFTEYYQVTCQ
jgi:hypothetical protein